MSETALFQWRVAIAFLSSLFTERQGSKDDSEFTEEYVLEYWERFRKVIPNFKDVFLNPFQRQAKEKVLDEESSPEIRRKIIQIVRLMLNKDNIK